MLYTRRFLLPTALCALLIAGVATPVAAQAPGAPGQPQVSVNGNIVTVSWTAPTTGGPVAAYLINATFNGVVIPGGPFNVGTITLVSAGPLPPGSYAVAVTAANASGSNTSAATTFTIGGGAPGIPTLAAPIVSGNTVTLQWGPVAGATGYELAAIVQATGQVLNLPLGNQTSVVAAQVPPGSYTVSVRATNAFGASAYSNQQTVVVGGLTLPGAPILFTPSVQGSSVTLNWAPPATGGTPTSYEINARVYETGQSFTFVLPASLNTITVPNVPAGNFIVSIRARNALGAGPASTEQIVVVGTTLIVGDLQITLVWNSGVDMDLHVIEPNGSHVYFADPTGTSAFLDVDDTNGFGPEHVYVQPGQALTGTYQIFIVQWGPLTLPTTSTIGVTLNPGAANERTAIFSRVTSEGSIFLGYNVANVDIGAQTIVETTGTRSVPYDPPAAGLKPVKNP